MSHYCTSRSNNIIRPTTGFVGFWAKTTAAGLDISLAIDNTNNVTADRGVRKGVISDGQWYLFDTADFTIDSIQIFGPDVDATVFIDVVAHNSDGSLVYLFSAPGDFEPDGDVDLVDFAVLALSWLKDSEDVNWNPICDISTQNDDTVNFHDLFVLAENWLDGVMP